MPYKLTAILTGSKTKKDAKLLWKRLQDHVLGGHYRTFLTEFTKTQISYEARAKGLMKLPDNFHFEDDDSAADKFAKLVSHQIYKLRTLDVAAVDKVVLKEAVSQDELLKDAEAFTLTIKCLILNLKDHPDLLKSNDNVTAETGSIISSLFSHWRQQKISPTLFKVLSQKIKAKLSLDEKNPGRDNLYFSVLFTFYKQVIQKKRTSVLSAGSTRDDLLAVFSASLTKELVDRKQSDPDAILPYSSLEEAFQARFQEFSDFMLECVEEADTEDMKRRKNNNHSHRRVESIQAPGLNHRRASTDGKLVVQAAADIRSSHLRNASRVSENASVPSNLNFLDSVGSRLPPEIVYLSEWLKDAFWVSRSSHEEVIRCTDEDILAKSLISEFEGRLHQIEADIAQEIFSPPISATYGCKESSFERPDIYAYWRKIEHQELNRLVFRLKKVYLDAAKSQSNLTATSEDRSEKSHRSIKIRVVEARGLLAKDEDGGSDPYVVVEHGTERYETEVVSDSLMPLWDQEMLLKIKSKSSKPITVTVWDKDEEEPKSPLSHKFWKDESDDFLGLVSFNVPALIEELESLPDQKFDKWYTLQKRSKRSHVAGEIRLAIEMNEPSAGAVNASTILPSDMELIQVETMPPKEYSYSVEIFSHVAKKLMLNDIRRSCGELGDGSLSTASCAILDELGIRLRLSRIRQNLSVLGVVAQNFLCPSSGNYVSVKCLSALYSRIRQQIDGARRTMSEIKLITPRQIDYTVDGTKIVNDAIISGSGDLLSNEDLIVFSAISQDLYHSLRANLKKYRESFPCDTPAGALVESLLLLEMLHEKCCGDEKLSFSEMVERNIKMGVVDNLAKLNELASPLKSSDNSQRLVQLSALILEELESDSAYFQKPFSADVNLLSLSAEVYVKHLMLEIQELVSVMTPKSTKQVGVATPAVSNSVFELYYILRDIQIKYKSFLKDQWIQNEFSVYNWFSACIHNWIMSSETKLLDWVDSAVSMDKFEAISESEGVLHSTSMIDLFFCLKQMHDCLSQLGWQQSDHSADDYDAREYQWALFVTRYSLLLKRAVARYCTLIENQVLDQHLKCERVGIRPGILSGLVDDAIHNLDSALGLDKPKAKAKENQAGNELIKNTGWLSYGTETVKTCIRVNNLEAARVQVNELFESLHINKIQAVLNRHKRDDVSQDMGTSSASISGYLTVEVVHAENLMACDAGGTSDAYCVVSVEEHVKSNDGWSSVNPWGPEKANGLSVKEVARTKIIPLSLNPRWDETFSSVIRCASQLQITVYDYDVIGKDDVCGTANITLTQLQNVLSETDYHDVWLSLNPQGRVLLRLQFQCVDSMQKDQLADAEFYFRSTLRLLKRNTGDLLDIMARSLAAGVVSSLTKIIRKSEKNETKMIFFSVNPSKSEGLTFEEVAEEMDPITEFLNESLAILSRQLYPKLFKDLLKIVRFSFPRGKILTLRRHGRT
eukprot:Partr_v1_DN28890_c0_g1_i2_m33021 putative C2 domain protein